MARTRFSVERLENPDESFVQEAADIMASVLDKDDFSIALTGRDTSLLPLLARAMIGGTALVPGMADVFVATDDSGRLIGFLVCVLPGKLLFSTQASRAYGYYAYAEHPQLDPRASALFKNAFAKIPLEANFPAKELEATSYYVNLAMVRAEAQGQGVASALFALAFARAHELRAPRIALIATNEHNVAIYRRIGLEVVREARLETPFNACRFWYLARTIGAA
ncbi:hypothetical protein PsYK624_076380 [Phanerochaete sordida]|uniref:N-acetyltransferase domain-containing protein n=1 Tax=Phanerochaete sordida TaxID=48140 RepID=A0A9P3G8U6_9APHY|nr:hypothetical protein PsYK624_076380 [Phanerochaete sordida]